MVKEQLARLAQRETETDLDELTSALITEKGKSFDEQEKAKILVSDVFWVNASGAHIFAS